MSTGHICRVGIGISIANSGSTGNIDLGRVDSPNLYYVICWQTSESIVWNGQSAWNCRLDRDGVTSRRGVHRDFDFRCVCMSKKFICAPIDTPAGRCFPLIFVMIVTGLVVKSQSWIGGES